MHEIPRAIHRICAAHDPNTWLTRGCWEGRIMWLSCNSAPGSLRRAGIAASFPHPVSAFLVFLSSLCCVVVLYCCIVVLYFCFCSGFARCRSFRCGSLLCLLASKR